METVWGHAGRLLHSPQSLDVRVPPLLSRRLLGLKSGLCSSHLSSSPHSVISQQDLMLLMLPLPLIFSVEAEITPSQSEEDEMGPY